MGALADFVQSFFGVKTKSRVNPVTATPGAGITLIARNNPDRLQLTIINLDAAAMYVSPSDDPSANKGILLDASGGNLTLGARDDAELVGMEWYLYSAAGGNIFVLETIAE